MDHHFDRAVVRDADGNRQTTVFDARGRVSQTIDALGTTMCFEYGPLDLAERILRNCFNPSGDGAPGGPAVADLLFEYDDYGNVLWSYDPDIGDRVATYVPGFFDVATASDANDQLQSFAYDSLGRIDEITLPSGEVIDYTWDVGKIGMLDEISRPYLSLEQFEYDAFMRPLSTALLVLGDYYAFDYAYAGGQLQSITYPGGFSIDYTYDGAGYMREALSDGELQWRADERNLLGQLQRASFGNELQTVRGHDWDGFLTFSNTLEVGAPSNMVERMSYTWNHLGQLQSRRDALSNQTQQFEYDALYRLTDMTTLRGAQAVGTEAYEYDRLGNFVSKSGAGAYSYQYGTAGNRVESIGIDDYTWDAAGQLLSRSYESFTWTGRGMLETYSSPEVDFEHMYAGSGARVRTYDHIAGTHTTFAGGLFQAVVEPDQTIAKYLVPGPDGVVAQMTRTTPEGGFASERWSYLHPDHLGSPRLVTDENGAVEEEVMFDPWGAVRSATDWTQPAKSLDDSSRIGLDYTGHDERLSSDLVNMNARYFDTRIGRSLSADTIIPNPLDSQSHNRFAYVLNNPLSYTDPTGHAPEPDVNEGYGGQTCGHNCRSITVRTTDPDYHSDPLWDGGLRELEVLSGPDTAADQIAASFGEGLSANHRVHAKETYEPSGNRHKANQNSQYPVVLFQQHNTRPRPSGPRRSAANIEKYGPFVPYVPEPATDEVECTGSCRTYTAGTAANDNYATVDTDPGQMAPLAVELVEAVNNSPGVYSAELTMEILAEGGVGLAFKGAGRLLRWARTRRAARAAAKSTAGRVGSSFGPNSVGSAQRIIGRTLQTGGRTVRKSTAKALNEATGSNLSPREWGRGLEALKHELDLPNNHHGKITEYGHYLDDAGTELGNILDYL